MLMIRSIHMEDAEAVLEADAGGWVSGMSGRPLIMIPFR